MTQNYFANVNISYDTDAAVQAARELEAHIVTEGGAGGPSKTCTNQQ